MMKPLEIRCLDCGDGTMAIRIPGTPKEAIYRCPKMHIRQLPKTVVKPSQHNCNPPPPRAA
jgi:hypothetical protein